MDSAVVTSRADLLPPIPLTVMMKSGELRLAAGRLRFTTKQHDLLLDAPVAELHSLAPAVIGIHLWHADKRYRFALGNRDRRAGAVDDVAALTAMWIAALQPLIGPVPAGLTVRKPWPRWAWMAGIVALSLFFVAAVVIVVRLKN
jgi:hypothetical protein